MHHRLARWVSTSTIFLAACVSGSGRDDSPVQIEEMLTWIERVHVEADRSRVAIAESFDKLNTLAAGRFDKESAASAFAHFVQATDGAEQQARRFREAVGPMLSAADPVFRDWQLSIRTISSERLRQRSELRYAVTRERYDAIKTAAVPAQDRFDAFVKSLRDHAAFLGHDLNAGALDEIQDEVKLVAHAAHELDSNMESCLAAARSYVEQSALPSGTSAAAPVR